MQIKVPSRACRKCGISGIPFFARRRTDRGNKVYISFTCIICRREDEAIKNRASYKKNPRSHIERVLKSRMKPENYRKYYKYKLRWSKEKHKKIGMEEYKENL